MAVLAPLASDGFNRADENPMAGNWTSGPGVAADVQILNHAVQIVGDPTVNGNGVAFWSASTWPANQWSEVTIPALPTSDDVGPAVRVAATTATYYLAPVYPNGRLAIYRAIDHSFSQLYTSGAGTVVAGDRVRLEAEGTVLRVYKNDVLVGEVVDDAIASGAPGLLVDDVSGTLDDWAGGSVESTRPAAPSNLEAIPVSTSRIDLSWTDNATNEDGFLIWRCGGTAACQGFAEIATVGPNVVSFQDSTATPSGYYRYRVRAHNSAGTSDYSNIVTALNNTIPPRGTPLATDAFNRPDENPIAGNWTSGPGVAADVQLLNDAVQVVGDPTVNGNGVALSSARTWPANQWSEVAIPALPTTDDVGPAVRIAATVATYYLAPVYPNGRLAIYRAIDHSFSELFTTEAGAVVAGDRVRLEAEGTALRVFRNDLLVGEVVDDAIASGAPGLLVDDLSGVVDDWAGGDLSAAPAPAAPTHLVAFPFSASRIDLSWTDHATNEDGYRIERCPGLGCSEFAEIATGGPGASFQDSTATPAGYYTYRVRAYNSAGMSDYSNAAWAINHGFASGAAMATDAFNRPDENPIAGNWTSGPGGDADVQLLNNAVTAVANADPNGVAFWNAATWPTAQRQWSEVTIRALPATGSVGPAVRIAATGGTYYFAPVYADGRVAFSISKNHSLSQARMSPPGTVVAGDRVRIEVTSATGGTAVRVYRNDRLLFEVPLAESTAIFSGSAGLLVDDTSGVLDDWAGGPQFPAAPTNPRAVPFSTSRIDFSWTDNATNEDGFRIERCAGAGCSAFTEIATVGPNVVSFQDGNATPSGYYSYRVRAHNSGGMSAYSPADVRASALNRPVPPGNPLATDAFNRPNENPIAENWTSGPGGDADVQLQNNAVKAVGNVDPNGVAFWNAVTWPAPPNQWPADQWSEVTIRTLPATGHAGPAVRIAATGGTYYFAAVYADGRVALCTSIDHSLCLGNRSTPPGTVVAGDRVRIVTGSLELYVFRNDLLVLQAADGRIFGGSAGIVQDDTSGVLDDWAGGPFGSSPPAAPTNLGATAVSAGRIDLSWTDNATNETGFRIERCAGAGCSTFTQITTVGPNAVTYQDIELTPSTSYSYRVRAHNNEWTSPYSNLVSATTPAPD